MSFCLTLLNIVNMCVLSQHPSPDWYYHLAGLSYRPMVTLLQSLQSSGLYCTVQKQDLWHESDHELSCFDPFRASQWPSDKATLLTLAPEAGGSYLPALSPVLFYSQSESPWARPSHLKPLHIAFGKARPACPENSLSSPPTHYLSTSRSWPSLDIHLKRLSPGKPSWLWRL